MNKNENTQRYRKTKKGVLTNLYHKMKSRNIDKGYGELDFSLREFHEFSISKDDFIVLYNAWVGTNFDKRFKPSIDRIDPFKGYTFDNMQWLFWKDNYYKGISETSEKKRKPILMYKNEELIGKFKSIDDARYFLGMKSNGNISECLKGNRNNVKGYTFKFEQPHLLKEDK